MKSYLVSGKPSKYFEWEEICNNKTPNAIKYVDSWMARRHLLMMDEIREYLAAYVPIPFADEGIMVSSWYRDAWFNKKVGGASNSCHLDACATDITNIDTGNEMLLRIVETAWQMICKKYGAIGGMEVYPRGYQGSERGLVHLDSLSDKFGIARFRYKDNR